MLTMKMAMLMIAFTATHAQSPTPQPSYTTTSGNPTLEDKRWTPTSELGECMGNCNDDDDCSGSLVCWDTGTDREVPVPGCSGTSTENWDYCVDSEIAEEWYTPLNFVGKFNYKYAEETLYACQGDCDSDHVVCAGKLECFMEDMAPPQCSGEYEGWLLARYCYDPLWGTGETYAPTTEPTTVPDGYLLLESIAHAYWVDDVLGECQGSCGGYEDCDGDLACDVKENVPEGCIGEATEDYRYCYDPDWTSPDATPAPISAGALTFSEWLSEGKQFMEIPETVSTTTVLVVAILAFLVWVSWRWYCWNKGGSYKMVIFGKEAASDSEMDIE